MSPQLHSETQVYQLQHHRLYHQRAKKHLCRKLHKYHTLVFVLALINLHTATLVCGYSSASNSLSSHRDDPFFVFYIPSNLQKDELSSNKFSPQMIGGNYFIRQRRSPNPSPDSVSSLYSALPAARTGNSAIYFGMSSSSMMTHESSVKHYSDNRKPAFKNCANYKPSVREEEPENTFVIMVQAEDPDFDQEIKYSLVQSATERSKFHIDPKSGVIVTTHRFDRDEPTYEKMVYVTVQATDNGNPTLDDVCTFKVIIEDVNDNAPVFNKARYDESISEDKQMPFTKTTGNTAAVEDPF
ncbi:DE-cadherin-like [Bactrocera tryoni]|uniref:DE-cadherin-like n=1 Tax=Bactrocera tryoni TaxID=59916 RepID=UPI001A970F00|nr:DE-cadherin-like [Bactrocera tryoni]